MAQTRYSADFADFGGDVEVIDGAAFGDRKRPKHKKSSRYPWGAFGNATKRRLKRPYLRAVVRKGRKLGAAKKIGQVKATESDFKWVTRGGGVYAAPVKKGGRKAPRKAAKKSAKKSAKKHAKKK